MNHSSRYPHPALISGLDSQGVVTEIKLIDNSPTANYAFHVTPARLVTALITDYSIYQPSNLIELKTQLDSASP